LLRIVEKYILPMIYPILMKLHYLLDSMKNTGLCVFTVSDLARLSGLKNDAASVYIHRMKSMDMIYPVERGKFAISSDPFVVSTQLVVPSYISLITAFYLHGRSQQVIDDLLVVSPRPKNDLTFMDTKIRFVRFQPYRMFGYRRVEKGESYLMLADLEKAAIDSLYLPRYVPVSQVKEALADGFDKDVLEEYAKMMKCEAVVRRTGFLLESLGEKTSLFPSSRTVYKLNPTVGRKGKYNGRWKMYVNEVLQ